MGLKPGDRVLIQKKIRSYPDDPGIMNSMRRFQGCVITVKDVYHGATTVRFRAEESEWWWDERWVDEVLGQDIIEPASDEDLNKLLFG